MVASRLRVLCVDGNRDAAVSEVMPLGPYGFEANACHDGPCAPAEGKASRPDVYLVDLNLPGSSIRTDRRCWTGTTF